MVPAHVTVPIDRQSPRVVPADLVGSPPHPNPIPVRRPPTFSGHYYAGGEYTGRAEHGKAIQVELRVPNDSANSSSFYYVILSAWDNAGSYDQVGFAADFGTWGLAYSTTSYCATTYYYSADAEALQQGENYLFGMVISAGNVTLTAAYASNGTSIWNRTADTGGTQFVISDEYTCDSETYYDYTDYEEVYESAGPVLPYDYFFQNNSVGGSLVDNWSIYLYSSPISVTVVFEYSNVTIENQPLILLNTSGVVGGIVGVDGKGFVPSSAIRLAFAGMPLTWNCTSDSSGNFPGGSGTPCTFGVPATPGGSASVEVSADSVNATAYFEVDPGLTLHPASGVVGTRVSVSGTGFVANSLVNISWDGVRPITSCLTDSDGAFPGTTGTMCAFAAPTVPVGGASVHVASSSWVTYPGVAVGSDPVSLTYDPARGEIFVSNCGSDNASIVNDSTNRVVATVTLGACPYGGAYDSRTGEVFIANLDSNNVSVVNDTSDRVVASIPVGTEPIHVAYDPVRSEVFVTNSGSDNVSVINGTTNRLVAWITVGANADGIVYDSSKSEMFVANFGSDNVSVINDSTQEVVGAVNVGHAPAGGITYDPKKGEVFIAAIENNVVSVISDSTNTVLRTISAGCFSYGAVYDPELGDVFISNLLTNNVTVISDSTDDAVGTFATGESPNGIAYDSGHGEMYVADIGTDNVSRLGPAVSSATFDVLNVTLAPTNGRVGSTVTVTGSGFSRNAEIHFTIAGVPVGSTCWTDATGDFPGISPAACVFTVPSVPGGPEAVLVSDGRCAGTVWFMIWSQVNISGSDTGADVGQSVSMRGSGFGSSVQISTFDLGAYALNCTSAVLGSCTGGILTTAPSGSFVVSFVVPAIAASEAYPVRIVDTVGNTGTASIVVYTDPSVEHPTSNPGSVDVGQFVTFSTSASGGSGDYVYAWTGLPSGCSNSNSASVSCLPTQAGLFSISVGVTDGNGWEVNSASLPFTVGTDPSATAPIPSLIAADVGQSVAFTTKASGGSGVISYAWSGLPSGCASTDANFVLCTLKVGGNLSIAVTVLDSNGFAATSPALSFNAYADPSVISFTVAPENALQGTPTTITTWVGGGRGPMAYAYLGLPPGCPTEDLRVITCAPSSSGTFHVAVEVLDADGLRAAGNATLTVTTPSHGSPATEGFLAIGGTFVLAIIAVGFAIARRRRTQPPTGLSVTPVQEQNEGHGPLRE
jgi:YVTN family beta-propeller protein